VQELEIYSTEDGESQGGPCAFVGILQEVSLQPLAVH